MVFVGLIRHSPGDRKFHETMLLYDARLLLLRMCTEKSSDNVKEFLYTSREGPPVRQYGAMEIVFRRIWWFSDVRDYSFYRLEEVQGARFMDLWQHERALMPF